MPSPASFADLLIPQSLRATSTEANGRGWSLTYDCFVCNSSVKSIKNSIPHSPNGFLLRLQTFHILDPLYMKNGGGPFLVDSDFHILQFPPAHLSSFSNVRDFVISTLDQFGVPATDPDPLARLILSFTLQHQQTSTTKVVQLYISFTIATVLRNQDEAIDWVHGGTADSQIANTLRSTCAAVAKLKRERFDGSLSNGDSCMVCLEGFEDGQKVSRLPCSHEYHFDCIKQWLRFNHRCPICRFPMPWVQSLLPADSTSNLDNMPQSQSHA